MAKILDGKLLRDKIGEELKAKITSLSTKPTLAILQVGSRAESNSYIRQKKLFGEKIGAEVLHISFAEDISMVDVEKEIRRLNSDTNIHGIILQLPVPKHLDREVLLELIDPDKDVDGLHSVNMKKLLQGSASGTYFKPATAKGVVHLLRENNVVLEGKHVLIIGRSLLVGQSIALLLLNENATVTIAHKKSRDITSLARQADIIISAAGQAKLVTKEFISESHQQIIIDVGINLVDGSIVGDVDFVEIEPLVAAITPVPGGVGPMTIVSLFENLVQAYTKETAN